MAEPQTKRWTLADLDALPDDGGWTRYEIIDGELYISEVPDNTHQCCSTQMVGDLVVWNWQARLGIVTLGPGLIFDDENNTIPDVIWTSLERRAALEQADNKLHGGPELVVEVLSPGAENARRDREVKRGLYARRGVDEYWIVDPVARTVGVYRRKDADLVLAATLYADDVLTSPLLPGFAVPISRFFTP